MCPAVMKLLKIVLVQDESNKETTETKNTSVDFVWCSGNAIHGFRFVAMISKLHHFPLPPI